MCTLNVPMLCPCHLLILATPLDPGASPTHTLYETLKKRFSLTVKLQLAHSGSSVVTCPFPAYSDPWDIFVATCSLRRCSLSGEILVPTSERLREGETEEGRMHQCACVVGFSNPLVLTPGHLHTPSPSQVNEF